MVKYMLLDKSRFVLLCTSVGFWSPTETPENFTLCFMWQGMVFTLTICFLHLCLFLAVHALFHFCLSSWDFYFFYALCTLLVLLLLWLATLPAPERVWVVGDQIFWDIQGKCPCSPKLTFSAFLLSPCSLICEMLFCTLLLLICSLWLTQALVVTVQKWLQVHVDCLTFTITQKYLHPD